MQVPERVRERMRKAGSGAAARKEGVAIAREMLAAVAARVAGAYIMPPLERLRARARGRRRVPGSRDEMKRRARRLGARCCRGVRCGCRKTSAPRGRRGRAGRQRLGGRGRRRGARASASSLPEPRWPTRLDDWPTRSTSWRSATPSPSQRGIAVEWCHRTAAGRRRRGGALSPADASAVRVRRPRADARRRSAAAPRGARRTTSSRLRTCSASGRDARELGALRRSPPAGDASGRRRRSRSSGTTRSRSTSAPAARRVGRGDAGLVTARRHPGRRAARPMHAGPAHDVVAAPTRTRRCRGVAPGAPGYLVFWLARRPEPRRRSRRRGRGGGARAKRAPTRGSRQSPSTRQGAGRGRAAAHARDGPRLGVRRRSRSPASAARRCSSSRATTARPCDGSGGALLRMRVRADGTDPPLALPGDGLGRGAPTLRRRAARRGSRGSGRTRSCGCSRSTAGAPLAPPSAEPLLDDARPLAHASGAARGDRILVADARATPPRQLRVSSPAPQP